jgi:hypothetical protein
VKVRDQDGNPISDMTVVIGTDITVEPEVTNNVGQAIFTNLCYGDDSLLTVFGGTFDNRLCQFKQQVFLVGSASEITINTDCT